MAKMNNLMSRLGATGGNPGMLSTEMIAEQRNDWFVKELVNNVREIKSILLDNNISKTTDLLNRPDAEAVMSKIERDIEKRFGIHVLIKLSNSYNIVIWDSNRFYDSVQLTHKTTNNIDYLNWLSSVGLFKNSNDEDIAETVTASRVINDTARSNVLLNEDGSMEHITPAQAAMHKSIQAYRDKLKRAGIIIDKKTATIHNLPKEYVSYLIIDWHSFLVKVSELPEEVAASILHEIGHAFTYIEYGVKHVYNTGALIDAMIEISSKGKSAKETLYYIADKIDIPDEDKKIIKSKSLIPATLYFIKCYAGQNEYAKNDMENEADRFCTRFGMGEYLASGVSKSTSDGSKRPTNEYRSTGLVFLVITTFTTIAVVFYVLAGAPLLMVAPFIGLYVLGFILSKFGGQGDVVEKLKSSKSYDEYIDRIKRIKFEMIRMLRNNTDLDKDYKNDLLEKMAVVEDIINKAPEMKPNGVLGAIGKFFTPKWVSTVQDLEKMDKELEAMMENDLYLATLKMELIKTKG